MRSKPVAIREDYQASGRLAGRVAVISGGDSGIGRAVAVHFASEGADVAIAYLEEERDARDTADMVKAQGRRCLLLKGDIGSKRFCIRVIQRVVKTFGRLDILVNNAAEQHPAEDFASIREDQLLKTFQTNFFGYVYLTQAALEHLKKHEGAVIINTTSVTAYRGSPALVDYSATKGAIVAFTRSLSGLLAKAGPHGQPIRVNAVAPGPIWTPLIPATFPKSRVSKFGGDTPLSRPGQPAEVATCFVFLASSDSSYMTGQVLHPNGGEIING